VILINAEIIAIGTEILLGDITNTNAKYLSKELAMLGINVYFHTTVGDNRERIFAAFALAFGRCDMVVATGGLGPTADDISKEIAAEYFGLGMELHRESLERIENFFARVGAVMTENNRRQAMMPVGARVLANNNGTAPGCILEKDGKILILLPGPPSELDAMYRESVAGYLAGFSNSVLVSRVLRLSGIGESAMETAVADILADQSNPTIAPYATGRPGETILRITALAACIPEAEGLISPIAEKLYARLGEHIFGEGDKSLAQTVVERLAKAGLTLALAESCTGGGLAAEIVGVSGASAVLVEGIVAYSNAAKIARLNVSAETLDRYGAVSEECAREMAKGLASISNADIAISITGIAGPDGGTSEKPVGLVFIAINYNGETNVKKLQISGNRKRIRDRAIAQALDMLIRI